MILQTGHVDRIANALDVGMVRQKVIANNIANVDVPGFKRSDVRFESLLQQQLQQFKSGFVGFRTDPRHLVIGGPSARTNVSPQIVTDRHSAMNNNGNNVDIDYEMAQLAQNQLSYSTLIQQLNHEFKMTRTAIDGRR